MNIQTVKFNEISFVNVTTPSELEIKYLKNNFNFNQLHLDDYLNKTQVPKVETIKDYTLIVLDFPKFNLNGGQSNLQKEKEKQNKSLLAKLSEITNTTQSLVPLPQFPSGEKQKRIIMSQIDLFIGKDYLVVVHDGTLPAIENLFSLCQKTLRNRNKYMGQSPVYVAYKIIDHLVDMCFPIISAISSTIDKIDRELDDPKVENPLEAISITRRNIVVFHTMIKPIIPLFKQIEEGKYKELNGSMQPFWSNILDHLLKIWDRLEDNRELLEGISVSHESFLTAKTNEIVKVLTIFSAIILPLTLFASVYGMNIKGLPVAAEHFAFEIIVGLMIITTIGMLITFKFKRWF